MKYCAKCGNPMEDDMMFCQKCGTKFEVYNIHSSNTIDTKIEKMKKFNLVLDSSTINWEYVHEDETRAEKIMKQQEKMCADLLELINDILSNVNENERDLIEREVYTFVLQMGCKMCKEAEKMFANYAGYKELYEEGNKLCIAGRLDSHTMLNQMIKQDVTYKSLVDAQCLQLSKIKAVLDEDVIRNNLEFNNMTKQLAEAFNSMWYREVKRHIDFYIGPSPETVMLHWKMYEQILKGLSLSDIDNLDESGWSLVMEDAVKRYNDIALKNAYLQLRREHRNALKEKESEIIEKQYWNSHPDEFKRFEECNNKIAEIKVFVSDIDKDINSLKDEKQPSDNEKINLETNLSGKKLKIEKLSKKIFGKKKAEEEIGQIKLEIEELENKYQEVNNKIQVYEKAISDKIAEINVLEEEIREIEREIEKLRNM